MSLTKVSYSMIDGEVTNILDYGADPTGATFSTAAIQAAFDAPGLAPVYFPPGTYKVTGTGTACLTLTKNKMLIGCGRASVIRADAASASTSLLLIAITDNGGFTDVRNWNMKDIQMFHNGGGFHGIIFSGGFSISTSQIDNCQFYAGTAPSSYGLYVFDQLSHSKITNCTFDTAYMKCFDANVFDKCTTFGTGNAILFDCELGVRNNSVLNCTIVNRDGQVYIANGDNIRIENNQMEVAQGFTPPENQSPVSSMVVLAGIDRPIQNTVIRANNFGGGTSVDHLIYVGNAQRTVITENQFIAANISEIELTAQSKYNVVAFDNTTIGSISDPRPGTLFKFLAPDAGVGNMGVLQAGNSVLNPQNSWSAPNFYKDANGVVTFIDVFSAGVTTPGTLIGTLPLGFRPTTTSSFSCTTSSGLGYVNINATTGAITSGSLPSNSGVLVQSFQSATTQE
jgi:hypothetical protein